ncbi:hypothetical protein EI546_01975 [Aequorivita sp. H23M31]|uniref:Uncharacterized protein n=1 Tax=Aequorivita ciconiae TaxID=2494375 RepID=A0A410FZW7_9FLAO|nr:hypothetical protein [Aequorivita sp. H23M31]QAA80572.1 hypothetical protein EI546_01975 [Aequorivita sp. H23M31]
MAIETEILYKSNFEVFVQLIDVIIWPLTLLFMFLIFRQSIANVILRLNTLKADTSGLQLSFAQKIEATKKLFQQIVPTTVEKSGGNIKVFNEENDTPFRKILKVRSELINYLKVISEKNNIRVQDLEPLQLLQKLKETGVITIQQKKMMEAMLEVTSAANDSATEKQAMEVEELMKKIEFK